MDGRSDFKAAMAIVVAIVGAGFASGREVVAFFTDMGAASWLGVAAACAGAGYLCYAIMALAQSTGADSLPALYGRLMGAHCERAMHLVYGLLALLTGAAMLAAGGELGALALPTLRAREIGLALTLLASMLAAHSGVGMLAALGVALAPCMAAYYGAMLVTGPPGVAIADAGRLALAVPMGMVYAAFNAAVAGGTACLAGGLARSPARAATWVALSLLMLLVPANAALLAADADVRRMVLPSVVLAARWGVAGYYASIAVMWMAVMTTLCAMLCSLAAQLGPLGLKPLPRLLVAGALVTLCSLAGFESLVGVGYPLMGLVCAMALMALPPFLPGRRKE
ncbi:MAG: hypothetical protein GX558_03350 [Clostridiales bacterium]|nr:hypothetical protein [Clostridiales bacterium]